MTALAVDRVPVLVVDDDESLTTTIGDILSLHGFATRSASSGRAALSAAREMTPPPAVALVDLRLPDMDGLDLASRLHAQSDRLQVIILTGNATLEAAIRALRDEKCDFLVKPVEPDMLVRSLRSAEGRWRLRHTEEALRRAEHELQQAQKLDAIGRLAGGVAHDFNNLLGIVLGEVDLADQEPGVPPRVQAALHSIRRTARRASELTAQLLAFARRRPVQVEVLDPNDAVTSMERMLRRVIGDRIRFTTDLAPDLWPVQVDRGQLEQVITNLVINARDAMPGGGTVTVATRNVPQDAPHGPAGAKAADRVLIAVTDTGTGIPDDVRARLFEPFFTTKQPGEGTGLGLATSYGIVQRFGGHVEVDTAIGRGSTFTVFLPRSKDGILRAETAVPGPAPAGVEVILVVEDHPQLRELSSEMLTRLGYTVHTAASGLEAHDALARLPAPPHLVVSDVHLPDCDGRDLVRHLCDRHPGMKALIASGTVATITNEPGAPAMIAKPYSLEELARAVRDALR